MNQKKLDILILVALIFMTLCSFFTLLMVKSIDQRLQNQVGILSNWDAQMIER